MDIENRLKEFKKIYKEVEPSKRFLEQGWQDLQSKMGHLEQSKSNKRFFYTQPFATATLALFVLIVISAGLVQASQKALPGQSLYPVKRLTENVIYTVSGNSTIKIENRAREIVELGKNKGGSAKVQRAVEEYKTAIEEASHSGKNRDEIEKSLIEHVKEFEQIKEGPSEKEINEAIEISKSGRGGDEDDGKSNSGKSGENDDEKDSDDR